MEPNITMHHACYMLSVLQVSSRLKLSRVYRCRIALTPNEHQWEVAAEAFSIAAKGVRTLGVRH